MTTDTTGSFIARRHFVAGLSGAGVAAAAGAALPNTAYALGGGTAISGFFDVTTAPYNASGSGITDAQPGIQSAINDAQANGGGIVWIPPGVYKLNSGLTVTSQVVICGAGWTTPPPSALSPPNNNTGNGSWLSVSSITFTPITIAGFGTVIRDIAFIHQQATSIPPSGWAPVNYPYAIEVNGSDVLLENIFLRNATRGIALRGALPNPGNKSVGRTTLKRIWGQPILEGVFIDNALDVIKIDTIHFWPFWSNATGVIAYQKNSFGKAFISKRNDNPLFSNIFVFGYNMGFYFSSSPPNGTVAGPTQRFCMNNCGADSCVNGIYVDGDNTSGMVNNFYSNGADGSAGIGINCYNASIQVSNARLSWISDHAVYVIGSYSQISLESVWSEHWDTTGLSSSAIYAASTCTVWIGFSCRWTGSASPQYGGGGGTYKIDQ